MNLKDGKCIVPASFQVNEKLYTYIQMNQPTLNLYTHTLCCGVCWMQNLSATGAMHACFFFLVFVSQSFCG